NDLKRKWYIIDANQKVLGRIATKISSILMGKHKTVYRNGRISAEFCNRSCFRRNGRISTEFRTRGHFPRNGRISIVFRTREVSDDTAE
ncbi:MAG: uL13 family ribosomal protein, partial [Sweet potato little leaf phytoplasma]|nr:uL13 family ribosomal protein [Sweet potato little leaf phytoplasma]